MQNTGTSILNTEFLVPASLSWSNTWVLIISRISEVVNLSWKKHSPCNGGGMFQGFLQFCC